MSFDYAWKVVYEPTHIIIESNRIGEIILKSKWRLYIVITLIIILAGGLLIAKGTDAVSQAESKKQGVLNTEPKTEGFYVDLYIPESQIN